MSIKKSYSKGSISSENSAGLGGFCGMNTTQKIEDCYSHSSIEVTGLSAGIGGFCGAFFDGIFINCYSSGNVDATAGSEKVGGFNGTAGPGPGEVYLSNCYSVGVVTCNGTDVGGFVGLVTDGILESSISNCAYWTGAFPVAFGHWEVPAETFPYDEFTGSAVDYSIGDKFYAYNYCPYTYYAPSYVTPPFWGASDKVTVFEVTNDNGSYAPIVFYTVIGISSTSNLTFTDEGFAAIRCTILGEYAISEVDPQPTYITMLAEVGGTDEPDRTTFYDKAHKVYAQGT